MAKKCPKNKKCENTLKKTHDMVLYIYYYYPFNGMDMV